jgi:hypothetical protein
MFRQYKVVSRGIAYFPQSKSHIQTALCPKDGYNDAYAEHRTASVEITKQQLQLK